MSDFAGFDASAEEIQHSQLHWWLVLTMNWKLRPYSTAEICILLLFYNRFIPTNVNICITKRLIRHGHEIYGTNRRKLENGNQYNIFRWTFNKLCTQSINTAPECLSKTRYNSSSLAVRTELTRLQQRCNRKQDIEISMWLNEWLTQKISTVVTSSRKYYDRSWTNVVKRQNRVSVEQ